MKHYLKETFAIWLMTIAVVASGITCVEVSGKVLATSPALTSIALFLGVLFVLVLSTFGLIILATKKSFSLATKTNPILMIISSYFATIIVFSFLYYSMCVVSDFNDSIYEYYYYGYADMSSVNYFSLPATIIIPGSPLPSPFHAG
jgi:hypothetical protein